MVIQDDTYRTLESMLCDKKGEPLNLKQHLLEKITNNFSEDNLIGYGGFGEVYKGVLGDGFIAVKKLYSHLTIQDEPFHREVDCLMNIRHHNIVLFVGYCAETQEVVVRQEGKNIFAEKRERLLCFEYLPNGSLRKHITAKPCGLPWRVCYQIIKGICLGLQYLHEKRIVHLDLKPENILLDDASVPKITDFGLSRLLGNGKSRTITQTRIGSRGYMAPEYIDDGVITMKSDIYSLGVIIRHMVKGHNSADTTDEDVLASWMIRLEKDSSQMRQQAQLLEVGYKEQIKACIEISWRCTRPKPKDRPTTQDILLTLEETEARIKSVVGPNPNAGQAKVARIGPFGRDGEVLHGITDHNGQQHSAGPSGGCGGSDDNPYEFAKFGPWGGDGGKPQDIKMLPYRLDRVTLSSGDIIDSIDFSYTDHDGQQHTTGPWGGHGGDNNSIQLGPSEFLIGVSGTTGPLKSLINVITSLTFVTNTRSYGPFGKGRGTPFHIQMQNNARIVGFFGRSNKYLNAIGVYTNKDAKVARIGPFGRDGEVLHDITDHNGQQHSAGPSEDCGGSDDNPYEFAKFGPWGGDGGKPQDIKMLPYRLDRVTVSSGVIIDSIEFSYTDHDGQHHTTGPWGGHGGDNNSRQNIISKKLSIEDMVHMCSVYADLFQLGPSEFLTGVSGSIGRFNSQVNVITSLTFVTNATRYGPFGKGTGTSFHIEMQGNGCIVGFCGRSGRYLNAIGVYTNPELKVIMKQEAEVARVGPWGGVGNVLHDITEKPHHLQRVTIFSGTIINSLEYLYTDRNGQQHTAGPWGGCGGNGRKIHLDPEEFIVKVSGTFHPCKTHGPFGRQLGAAFQLPVGSNSRIVGFFAHGDNYIEAIGAYVLTL